MGSISSPTHAFCLRPQLVSPLFATKSSCSYNPRFNLKSIPKAQQPQRLQVVDGSLPPLSNQALLQLGFSPNRKRLLPVVSCSSETAVPNEGPPEGPQEVPKEKPKDEDHRAVETVQKLYTAIKNKNVKEVSDVIGDECRCFCNFISASQPFHGKKVGDRFQRIIAHDLFLFFSPFLNLGINLYIYI